MAVQNPPTAPPQAQKKYAEDADEENPAGKHHVNTPTGDNQLTVEQINKELRQRDSRGLTDGEDSPEKNAAANIS